MSSGSVVFVIVIVSSVDFVGFDDDDDDDVELSKKGRTRSSTLNLSLHKSSS
jgi:hypothetical protein